jgi:hypothetical protein
MNETKYVLVPVEPTEEMLKAMRKVIEQQYNHANYECMYKERHAYKALLSAAIPAKGETAEPDTSQDWANLDGGTAFHLIERHADDWNDARNMMETWAQARFAPAQPQQLSDIDWKQHISLQPVACDDEPDAHNVIFKVGVQSFVIGCIPHDTKAEAEWFASQFINALARAIESALLEKNP